MLSEIQLYVIAALAPVIIYVINLLIKAKVQVGRGWLTAGVYVISGLLAFAWTPLAFPSFPPFVDLSTFIPLFITWISDLLVLVGPMVALATLIYNSLLKRVLDGLSVKIEQMRQPKAIG